MNDDDFLAEILADPEDDFPRLVYADWLDEQGDPRGLFIRLSIDYAHRLPLDPARDRLREELRDLADIYSARWKMKLRVKPPVASRYRRGLLEELILGPTQFQERWEALTERVPTLSHIWFRLSERHHHAWDNLAESVGELRRLRGVNLSGTALTQPAVRWFSEEAFGKDSPLTELNVSGTLLRSNGFHELLCTGCLAHLRTLIASEAVLGSGGSRQIIGVANERSGPIPLRVLNLSRNGIEGPTLEQFLTSKVMTNLEQFDISYNRIEPDVAQTFRELSALPLRYLNVAGADWNEEAIGHFLSSPGLSNLESLDLSGIPLSDESYEQLADPKNLPSLKFLAVRQPLRVNELRRKPKPDRRSPRKALIERFGSENVTFVGRVF